MGWKIDHKLLVTKTGLFKELKEIGIPIGPARFDYFIKNGIIPFRVIFANRPGLRRYVVSRVNAEKIKRVLWVYFYDDIPYPKEIEGGDNDG